MLKKIIIILFGVFKRLILYFLMGFISSSLLFIGVFRYFPVPVTTFMLYRHIEDFQAGKDYREIEHHWIEADKISRFAFAAVIAAEDQKFYTHHGFDKESMVLAIETWLDGGKLRGASTISQQLAKNIFLIPVRSFWRKGFEAWFTILIETAWSKQRILEVYLNSIEFGDHLFGIEAASQKYFSVPALQISRAQSALLAASLPNPRKYLVSKPSNYLRQRQRWIMRQMNNLGY